LEIKSNLPEIKNSIEKLRYQAVEISQKAPKKDKDRWKTGNNVRKPGSPTILKITYKRKRRKKKQMRKTSRKFPGLEGQEFT
jgi:hypothetical protein